MTQIKNHNSRFKRFISIIDIINIVIKILILKINNKNKTLN